MENIIKFSNGNYDIELKITDNQTIPTVDYNPNNENPADDDSSDSSDYSSDDSSDSSNDIPSDVKNDDNKPEDDGTVLVTVKLLAKSRYDPSPEKTCYDLRLEKYEREKKKSPYTTPVFLKDGTYMPATYFEKGAYKDRDGKMTCTRNHFMTFCKTCEEYNARFYMNEKTIESNIFGRGVVYEKDEKDHMVYDGNYIRIPTVKCFSIKVICVLNRTEVKNFCDKIISTLSYSHYVSLLSFVTEKVDRCCFIPYLKCLDIKKSEIGFNNYFGHKKKIEGILEIC